LRKRHHYATSGCRMILDTRVRFDADAERFADDPNLGPTKSTPTREAMMGDILRSDARVAKFRIHAIGSAPIECVEIRNGLKTLEVYRPFGEKDLGRRIRVIWEGSEYRGRGRQTIWDGGCMLTGNRFTRVGPINFWNLDRRLEQLSPTELKWSALTTGCFGGFDAWLENANAGSLKIDTALVKTEINVADIGLDDRVFDAGGIKRRIRVFRMPDENPHVRVDIERDIDLVDAHDNALYVCLVQEDGNLAWSSPIYVFGS
jgi:hypothetical protein